VTVRKDGEQDENASVSWKRTHFPVLRQEKRQTEKKHNFIHMKNRNTTSAKKTQQKENVKKFPFSEQQTIWGARTIFFLFSFYFLGIYNSELMFKLQNANFFLNNSVFFDTTMQQSAGMLMYTSGFLTQLLYYPLLGALTISLLLSSIEIGISRLYRIPSRWFLLSFLPSGIILLMISSIGYAVYDRFDTFQVFSSIIGVICILGILWLNKSLSKTKGGAFISMAVASAMFFLIGSFALFAILTILAHELTKTGKSKYIHILVGISLIGALPYLTCIYHIEQYKHTLLAPIAGIHFLNLFVLTIAALATLATYPLLEKRLQSGEGTTGKGLLLNAAGTLLLLACIFHFSFRDENFRTELKMQRLCEQHDWKQMLETANQVEEPTKAIAAYRIIALANKNILARELFRYPCIEKKSASQYLTDQPIYYEDLFLYASFPNNAYLWSMEFWVTTGSTYEHLKKMALCALLNDESDLAKRYIGLLKQTMFQSKWAEEHEQYIDHPEKLFRKYPEFVKTKKEMPVQDKIITMEPLSKTYMSYSKMGTASVERRLLADIYRKDMKAFMIDIIEAQSVYKDGMPSCIKEALVICAINGNPKILIPFRVERPFAQDVANFFNEVRTYSDRETASKALKGRYGNTFSYYFVFSNMKE